MDNEEGNKPDRALNIIKKIAWGALSLLGVGLLGMLLVGVYFYFQAPSGDLSSARIPKTSIIYDRSGEHVLYEVHGEENRKVLPHDQIPDFMRQSTIAAEDASFYSHFGLDIGGIIRSIKTDLAQNKLVQGGSTITQQLARNAFLTREKTWKRKINEMMLAFKIESRYSKDEILDAYLNQIPYGSNAYGVQAAAETFFNKDAKDLTLDEAALLAALPKATTDYSPYGNHQKELIARQQMIIREMMNSGLVAKDMAEKALLENTLAKVVPLKTDIDTPHFVFYAIEELEGKFGKDFLEEGGYKIYTTLDYDKQKMAEDIVKSSALIDEKTRRASNAALVAIDPKSGDILTMVGSRDYYDKTIDGQVNVATSVRSPGSSFKPIVYAKVFEKGYQPETLIYDVKTDFGSDGSGRNYEPQNYNGNFNGPVSIRQALANSLNIPAVKALYIGGIYDTIDLAKRLGITTLDFGKGYGLSLALGGGGVTLLDETSAFSVFANDGIRNPATSIYKITDSNGQDLAVSFPGKGDRAIDAQVARKVSSILSDDSARSLVFGMGTSLAIKGKKVASKSGTTQDFRDAWTVGYTPSIAVGVWVGNNDNSVMRAGSDGSVVAAPIWNKFMTYCLQNYPDESFIEYDKATSDKPMITGRLDQEFTYYKKGSDKKISEEKAKKMDPDKVRKKPKDTPHDILYYVNKDNPLSNLPPDFNDPMAWRFDEGVIKYYEDQKDKDKDKDEDEED